MAWLVRDATVLASLEVADTFRSRLRGLLGRDGLDGAILLRPARSVHTLGMRFPIDVAFCDGDLNVLQVRPMRPWRVSLPVRRACVIIEAEQGAFERWQLAVGDELAVHGDESTDGVDLRRGDRRPASARLSAARRRLPGRARSRSRSERPRGADEQLLVR